MTTITADYDLLFQQTETTVEVYFKRAVRMIDNQFGKDYAKHNPNLVAALVDAMAKDMASSTFGKSVGEFVDAFRDKDFHDG